MTQNYTLGQRYIAYILFVSLFLQSCNHFYKPLVPLEKGQEQPSIKAQRVDIQEANPILIHQDPIQVVVLESDNHDQNYPSGARLTIVSPGGLDGGRKEGQEPKQEEIVTRSTLGQLDRLPVDVLKIIFSYAASKEMSKIRQLSKAFYKLTTGYNEPKLGVRYKPEASMLTDGLALNTKVLNFKDLGEELIPEHIPSFSFYRLLGEVQHIPPPFWPYLAGTHVQTLDLRYNQIRDAGVIELAKHLKGSQVQTLNLGNNQIGASGAIELANHLRGTHIKTLDLRYNQIGASGAIELAKNLKGTQVETLHLSYNKIGSAGSVELAKHLRGSQVQTLNLYGNQIGASGAIELAKSLKGSQVQTLNLYGNQIGASGAIELAKNLKGTQVQTLDLGYNQIGDAGSVELAKNLKGTQVETLYLGYNQISAETERTLKEQYPHIRWEFLS